MTGLLLVLLSSEPERTGGAALCCEGIGLLHLVSSEAIVLVYLVVPELKGLLVLLVVVVVVVETELAIPFIQPALHDHKIVRELILVALATCTLTFNLKEAGRKVVALLQIKPTSKTCERIIVTEQVGRPSKG